jgi:hypothetical protein
VLQIGTDNEALAVENGMAAPQKAKCGTGHPAILLLDINPKAKSRD